MIDLNESFLDTNLMGANLQPVSNFGNREIGFCCFVLIF
jgi:hypothetical protein